MGTMGHGIAHVAAAAGFTVHAYDVSTDLIEKGLSAIRANLDKGVEKGKVTEAQRDGTLARLLPAADLAVAAHESFLVIEAAPESIELKHRIFRELDRSSPAEAILASNTSSLSIGEIAKATRRHDRVVGMHFFNPVHLMPLIEVVQGDETADATVAHAVEVGREMGKEPIVVRDAPGFATSRLGVALGLEAMRMAEQGVASVEDIDKAMTLGYRHPMGPLRLTDLIGLDVRLAIAENLFRELGTEAFRPPEILERMVAEGRLGKKTGHGFYRW
jgi:3-hydroxybutyryl-CoA dehydrogenase